MTDIGNALYDALAYLQDGPAVPPIGLGQRAVRRRRRRQAWATTSVAIAVLALIVPVTLLTQHLRSRTQTPAAEPTATAAALARGHWSVLTNAPIAPRTEPAAVWTGTQMLVWGGRTDDDKAIGDGAAFDPAGRTWTVLPPSPLTPRDAMAAVWTGGEMVIWGGRGNDEQNLDDGAAYDPTTKTWRLLPPSPLAARSGATAVYAAGRVAVLGGLSTSTPAAAGAIYDPASNSWTSLPAFPSSTAHEYEGRLAAVTTGRDILVEAAWTTPTSPNQSPSAFGVEEVLLDPTAGTFSSARDDGGQSGVLAWTGKEVVAAASPRFFPFHGGSIPENLTGERYDPATKTWRPMSHGPVDDLNPKSVWTGAALLSYDTMTTTSGGTPEKLDLPGEAAAWDPATDHWFRLPNAPASGADAAVWTGTELIEWGSLITFAATTPQTGYDTDAPAGYQTLAFSPAR